MILCFSRIIINFLLFFTVLTFLTYVVIDRIVFNPEKLLITNSLLYIFADKVSETTEAHG